MSKFPPERDRELRRSLALDPDAQRTLLEQWAGTTGEAGASSHVEFTATIEYLHHTKPHHSDTAEEKAEKARVSALASELEGSGEYEHRGPMELWTADDIRAVIDRVRAGMPTERVDGRSGIRSACPNDRFADDGRAIQCLRFGWHTKKKVRDQREMGIWFSTAAGFAARIVLPGMPPVAAMVPFVCESSDLFEVEMNLNLRRARTMARRDGA